MKIVSLLPSATELVFSLGKGDLLVGVTDECDYPPEAVTKPVVSRSALPQGRPLSSLEIDRAVREKIGSGEPLYLLDKELLRREQPDVILTQDLCRVCAVPSGQVERALEEMGTPDAKVVSLDPQTLEDVIGQLEVVGKLVDAAEQGYEQAELLRARVARVKEIGARLPMVSAFCLEWSDPPFAAGHWIPEMVEATGAKNLMGDKGEPSREISWHEIGEAAPEVIVFMPCGYYLEEAEEEARSLFEHPDLADTPAARNGNVYAVDATSYFSRSGPRIVDGLEILAWCVHPEAFPQPAPGAVARVGRA